MDLRVFLCPELVEPSQFVDQAALVVDILRATSTITEALANGAASVRAVADQERARSYGDSSTLLCGERLGKRISEFDHGNSPREMTSDAVQGKHLIMCSTNGSRSMEKVASAQATALGSFLNADAVTRWCRERHRSLAILCSGKLGAPCEEDTAFAGYVVSQLQEDGFALNDGARLALAVWEAWQSDALSELERSMERRLLATDHGRYLASQGFEADVRYCSGFNRHASVAVRERAEETFVLKS